MPCEVRSLGLLHHWQKRKRDPGQEDNNGSCRCSLPIRLLTLCWNSLCYVSSVFCSAWEVLSVSQPRIPSIRLRQAEVVVGTQTRVELADSRAKTGPPPDPGADRQTWRGLLGRFALLGSAADLTLSLSGGDLAWDRY